MEKGFDVELEMSENNDAFSDMRLEKGVNINV